MQILRGKAIANKILDGLRKKIKEDKIRPGLAVVLVGKNNASELYVRLKKKAAEEVGIKFFLKRFAEDSTTEQVIREIKNSNSNPKISGMIVQLPLPKKFNTQKIINAIAPEKDVDGFHPQNLKKLKQGKVGILPVFPEAIFSLLEASRQKLQNSKIVIVAKSKTFGETMRADLAYRKIKSEYVLSSELKNNLAKIKNADILITAVGKPELITGVMVKDGVIIIDGGIKKSGKVVLGDVDFESVKSKASHMTPVPGGVGPVTIACLLKNTYLATKKSR